MEKEVEGRKQAEELNDMLRDHLDELEEYVDPEGKQLFRSTVGLLRTMHDMQEPEVDNETEDGITIDPEMLQDGDRNGY